MVALCNLISDQEIFGSLTDFFGAIYDELNAVIIIW